MEPDSTTSDNDRGHTDDRGDTDSKAFPKPTHSKKDFWDKLDVIGKAAIALITAIAAVVIPIVVTWIGGQVQNTVTAQNTGKDYIQIALGILEKKDLPDEMAKNRGLREWAVNLLRYYSKVPLDQKTADDLVGGQTVLPPVVAVPPAPRSLALTNNPNPSGAWASVLIKVHKPNGGETGDYDVWYSPDPIEPGERIFAALIPSAPGIGYYVILPVGRYQMWAQGRKNGPSGPRLIVKLETPGAYETVTLIAPE